MEYKIRSRIWIEVDGEILLGEGRVQLLKAIEESGSLTKAAKSLGMSYKKAWSLIDAVNSRAKEPVIATSVGGKKGGGTVLTAYGASLVETFDRLNEKCWMFLDEQISTAHL
jgi:molybdate transport system regulatory protein